jgi:selenide,water dikinase
VRDPEIKFGYAVTGLVDPKRMFTNAAGRAGEALVLTKPLGTGVIATALKAGKAPAGVIEASTLSMSNLNRAAAQSALDHGVQAATDVTGFGLLGHAAAIARESRLTLEICIEDLPLLPGALELAEPFSPAGLKANRRQFEPLVEFSDRADPARRSLLFDPQTSGGLLLLVPSERLAALLQAVPEARTIGRTRPAGPHPLAVV